MELCTVLDRRRARRHARPRSTGFTILELLVLLTALSAFACWGIPAYFGRPSVTLDNAARLLANDLREIQNRAALYEEELWIRFEDDGTGYRATDRTEEPLISAYGTGPFVRDYPVDAVFRGVTIEAVTPERPGAAVFDANGRPRGPLEITIAYAGETRTVSVRERSGLISIDGLDEPWIDLGD